MLLISHLSKTYPGGVRALHDVSLAIEPGLYGLLGPNGAGKSTLMRTLATLQAPDAGSITFDGADVLADPVGHRRRLGYLPQDFGVYRDVSALVLLDHLARLKGLAARVERREQVEGLLAQTNLWAHRHAAVSGFSGGMRQRFGVAQALLGSPRLLIVDEPTAGLDPGERDRFYALLASVGDDVVVLLSTHIVEDVRQLCPRVAVLAGGRVRAEGRPADLVAALDGRVWRATVDRAEADAIRAEVPVLSSQLAAGQTRLHVLADASPGPAFAPVAPDLEDVYFATLSAHS